MIFFSIAGVMFRLCAVALVVLASISLSAPSVRDRLRHLLPPITCALLVSASVVAAAYLWELLAAATSSNLFERYTFWHARAGGSYAWFFWLTLALALVPLLLWFVRFRQQPLPILLIAVASLLLWVTEQMIVAITSWFAPHPQ